MQVIDGAEAPSAAEITVATWNTQWRTPTNARSVRHIREPRQMQLMRHGDRLRRAITVLTHDQVRFTAPRIIPLEGVGPVQQNYHIGILL